MLLYNTLPLSTWWLVKSRFYSGSWLNEKGFPEKKNLANTAIHFCTSGIKRKLTLKIQPIIEQYASDKSWKSLPQPVQTGLIAAVIIQVLLSMLWIHCCCNLQALREWIRSAVYVDSTMGLFVNSFNRCLNQNTFFSLYFCIPCS